MNEFQEKLETLKDSFVENASGNGFSLVDDFEKEGDDEPSPSIPEEEPTNETQDNNQKESQSVDFPLGTPSTKERKKKHTRDKRIDQLTAINGSLQQQNFFLQASLAEKERIASEAQARLQKAEEYAQQSKTLTHNLYDHSLLEKESLIREKLMKAKEEGDIALEIEAIDELSDIKSERKANELYRYQQEQERLRQEQESLYQPVETALPYQNAYIDPRQLQMQMDMEPQVPDHFSDWIEENPWYEQNDDLKRETNEYATELDKHLAFIGHVDMIGTKPYLDMLSKEMRRRYLGEGQQAPVQQSAPQSIAPQPTTQERPYKMNVPVAPVSRKGTSMADQYLASNPNTAQKGYSLSPEELQVAKHLQIRSNGGKFTTGEAAVKAYQQAKNYPKSPLPGGSPYRLTILD